MNSPAIWYPGGPERKAGPGLVGEADAPKLGAKERQYNANTRWIQRWMGLRYVGLGPNMTVSELDGGKGVPEMRHVVLDWE
jgi:hypothetical protein